MSDVREVNNYLEAHPALTLVDDAYECENCGDAFPTMREAERCEARDDRRHSPRRVMRPARRWEDD